jgi:hypothetical protein
MPEDRRPLGTPARLPELRHVGCCDQSPNRHATRHFHATGHAMMRSGEPGETWAGATSTPRCSIRFSGLHPADCADFVTLCAAPKQDGTPSLAVH